MTGNLHASTSAFLSTSSARRATLCMDDAHEKAVLISIHVLREEGDRTRVKRGHCLERFLSTSSARRATSAIALLGDFIGISIHVLREEGDLLTGGRSVQRTFLSTSSARRATYYHSEQQAYQDISIHVLREEGDGGRASETGTQQISIHVLREEGDGEAARLRARGRDFYPRPPRGGRPVCQRQILQEQNFYPRPPRGGRQETGKPLPGLVGFLSTSSARRATAKTERKPSAFVPLYTSLHKLQRGACKTNRKITPLLVQTAGIPVRSVRENHVCCRLALAGHQKISTLSCANSGCSPTCSTLVW